MNFITNRKYRLNIDSQYTGIDISPSSGLWSATGVAHWSDPLVLFTMDIVHEVQGTNINIALFADDTKHYGVVDTVGQRIEMQAVIDRIDTWSNNNHSDLNAAKTYHTTYSKRGVRRYLSHYYMGDDRIQYAKEVNDLGVTFDEVLSFSSHIKKAHTSALHALIVYHVNSIPDVWFCAWSIYTLLPSSNMRRLFGLRENQRLKEHSRIYCTEPLVHNSTHHIVQTRQDTYVFPRDANY